MHQFLQLNSRTIQTCVRSGRNSIRSLLCGSRRRPPAAHALARYTLHTYNKYTQHELKHSASVSSAGYAA